MADPKTLVDLAMQFRGQVLKRDAATLKRLTESYGAIYKRARADMDNLINAILASKDGTMTAGQVQRLGQYKDLLANLEREVNQYGGFLQVATRTEAEALIAQAARDAKAMIGTAAGGNAAVIARINTLNPQAIEALLGFLDPQGKLWQFWASGKAGAQAAEEISKVILENVGLGRNPRTWAGALQQVMGRPLSSALKTARTVQLYSYREANRANFIANKEIVVKWQWVAMLDADTCPACLALHGQEFELEQSTDGHYNCRCTCVPVTVLTTDKIESGETWFAEQPASTQEAILGPGKYEAWKNGEFDFSQLAAHNDDAVFGKMWQEASLDSLVQPG
jgi:SPP1 gp7 family putative phage head morphogenesis protein